MRVDKDPFKDNKVRSAFKLAVDRDQLVKNVFLGYGSIGNDLPGKGYADYNSSLAQHTYDPEQAKSLSKQAGTRRHQRHRARPTRTALPSSPPISSKRKQPVSTSR